MTTIDKKIHEATKRLEWFINGRFIHCLPPSMWANITTERIVELYNVELEYFRPWIIEEQKMQINNKRRNRIWF